MNKNYCDFPKLLKYKLYLICLIKKKNIEIFMMHKNLKSCSDYVSLYRYLGNRCWLLYLVIYQVTLVVDMLNILNYDKSSETRFLAQPIYFQKLVIYFLKVIRQFELITYYIISYNSNLITIMTYKVNTNVLYNGVNRFAYS